VNIPKRLREYFRGVKFKEVSWRWTAINILFTWHGGRNPVNGHRFLYIGVGPFLGFDFYWPNERKQTAQTSAWR
jgi:hypothetical protein